jgi:hypothetical protein
MTDHGAATLFLHDGAARLFDDGPLAAVLDALATVLFDALDRRGRRTCLLLPGRGRGRRLRLTRQLRRWRGGLCLFRGRLLAGWPAWPALSIATLASVAAALLAPFLLATTLLPAALGGRRRRLLGWLRLLLLRRRCGDRRLRLPLFYRRRIRLGRGRRWRWGRLRGRRRWSGRGPFSIAPAAPTPAAVVAVLLLRAFCGR